MFTSPEIEKISQNYVEIEIKMAALEAAQPKLQGKVEGLLEAELQGKSDPKALAAARAEIADTREKISACERLLGKIRQQLEKVMATQVQAEYQDLTRLNAKVDRQRRAFAVEFGRALAIARFFETLMPQCLNIRLGSDAGAYGMELRKGEAEELARLQEVFKDSLGFPGMVEKQQFLQTWRTETPEPPTGLNVAQYLEWKQKNSTSNLVNEGDKPLHVARFAGQAIASARKKAGVEAPKPKKKQGSEVFYNLGGEMLRL